jgi:hypothetical protein
MIAKLRTLPTGRTVLLAVLCAVFLFGGFLVGRASAGQPHMKAALDSLQAAKTELNAAEADKGGHRVKALELVNSAIAEVQAGIEYAKTH